MIQNDQVAEVVVTYADRLTRFGLEYLTVFFAGYDVRFTVLHPNDGKTPEQELTDDLIAILTSFSGRLYGMRSHKQKEITARIYEAIVSAIQLLKAHLAATDMLIDRVVYRPYGLMEEEFAVARRKTPGRRRHYHIYVIMR